MGFKMVYLATPYTHPDEAVREARFEAITARAADLWSQGVGVYYQQLGDVAGFSRPMAWKHCRANVIPGEAALRYHRALGIPLADLRPDLYGPTVHKKPSEEGAA